MPTTLSYAALLAETKRSLASLAAQLAELSAAEGGSAAGSSGLGPEGLRAALRLTNRAAIMSGLISHRPLVILAASLRSFLHRKAQRPDTADSGRLAEAARLMAECADSLESIAEYGELVSPAGKAARPPVKRPVDVLGFCQDLVGGRSLAATTFDGRFLPNPGAGTYVLPIDPLKADDARSRGAWLSVSYFDPGSGGIEECVNALMSLLADGKAVRYGALELNADGSGKASLPCYVLAETPQEPGEYLPGRLPGARVLRVVASPHRAFVPDPGSGGPLGGDFRLRAEPEAGQDVFSGEPGPESIIANTRRADHSEPRFVTPAAYEGAQAESGRVAGVEPAKTPVPEDRSEGSLEKTDDILSRSKAIDEELPEGIVFPEMDEGPTETFKLEDFEPHAKDIISPASSQSEIAGGAADLDRSVARPLSRESNGHEEMAALLKPVETDNLAAETKASPPRRERADAPRPAPEPQNRPARPAQAPERSNGPAYKEKAPVERIRLSIALKLIGIISILIAGSLVTMIVLASIFFRQTIKDTVDDANLQIAVSIGKKIEADFASVQERAGRVAQAFRLKEASAAGDQARAALAAEAFLGEGDLLAVGAYPESGKALEMANLEALAAFGVEGPAALEMMSANAETIKAASSGEQVCRNASAPFKEPVILAAWGYTAGDERGALVALFASRESVQSALESSGRQTIRRVSLVSASGELLAGPDAAEVSSGVSLAGSVEYRRLAESKVNAGQFQYRDDAGLALRATYSRPRSLGAWVLVTVEEAKAFAAVVRVQNLNALLTLCVVAAAVLILYFFARTLTVPIRALVDAAHRIEAGQFSLRLRPRARDELGLLTTAFVNMGRGLAERERLKDSFGKFVNKEIAEQAAKGTLKTGGERKRVTIFFSDIRGFTSISEKLEPEEVVEFLNKYMTRMVSCVNATGGNVDKYIGDAIMAVWGAPLSELSESEYAERAVNAALMMRKELMEFNADRGGPRTPLIRIGCGINSGPVIAGQIGSDERLEYTVIGDAVNLASRIEALNKPFGSDILVSQDSYALVKPFFRVEEMKPIMVKGKNEPQRIFAVLGRLDDPYCPNSLAEVQSMLGIEHKDLSSVNVDEEEVKYKVIEPPAGGGARA